MDNFIKVSVIVPIYNTSKYLVRCLESVLRQELQEMEIILINDCSTDESLKILKEYEKKDSRIIVINLEKNIGLSAVRNTGIKKAVGKYLLHLDSDDWIEESYIRDMYEKAETTGADIVISDYYIDYDNGKKIYISDETKEDRVLTSYECIKNICEMNASPAVWNKLIKRKLYTDNGIVHPEGVALGEDLAVMLKLLYNCKKIVKINRAYTHYIQHPESITNSKIDCNKLSDIENSIKLNSDFLEKNNMSELVKVLEGNVLGIWIYRLDYSNNEIYQRNLSKYLQRLKYLNKRNSDFLINRILKVCNNRLNFFILLNLYWILEEIKRIVIKNKKSKNENI